MLGLEQFQDGWPTEKSFLGAHELGQSAQKRLVWVCEGSLLCTHCPHSCAPGKDFPVVAWNYSRPSTLNLRILWRWASRKEVTTCLYEYPINPIKPQVGMAHPHPLKRPTSSSLNPKPGTSSLGHVHVSSASACAMLCDHSRTTLAMHPMPTQLWHTRPWNRESRLQ
jgi:hypothetical protein